MWLIPILHHVPENLLLLVLKSTDMVLGWTASGLVGVLFRPGQQQRAVAAAVERLGGVYDSR
jgi:hypothetical protein